MTTDTIKDLEESPVLLQDEEAQELTFQEVIPQESPLQEVIPQESTLQAVVAQESILQAVVPQESLLQNVVPQETSMQDEVPPNSLAEEVGTLSGGKLLRDEQMATKLRRVQEVCRRLKLQEQKEREMLLQLEKGTSSPDDSSWEQYAFQENIEEDIESQNFESNVSWTSVTSDGDEDPLKRHSEVDSESSLDPLRTAVDGLMLVPSISDLSLSDDFVIEHVVSQKSFAPGGPVIQTESDSELSSESQSADLSELQSGHSLQKVEVDNEKEDTSSSIESVAQTPIITKQSQISFLNQFFSMNTIYSQAEQQISKPTDTKLIIKNFITVLITNVIDGLNHDQLLRTQLDKNKLISGLLDGMEQLIEVANLNRALNQLMVEHYLLTKNKRALEELSDRDRLSYQERYSKGLASVALGEDRVALIKVKVGKLTTKAQLELNNAMYAALGTEHHLEQTVRQVLIRSDSENDLLKRLVARELRLMQHYRREVGDNRYLLIIQKHNLAKLEEEIKELGYVDDHVSMDDFLCLQSKLQGIERKVEDRNAELKMMRAKYHKELTQGQHNREKMLALQHRLIFRRDQLAKRNIKKTELRNQLYLAKIQRKSIRAKTNELVFQGGIISMPSLMYDYDRTQVYIQETRERVAGLKETVQSLIQRISFVCQKDTNSSINY
ncbi:uncharacterized protein [Drosophila kikkawai]|uniref:CCDC113/CCDC96 coiled-coil domain-containing protein n=1 Tax=Drosophila kikkawai TaxID=30033 RepID=A0ABM4GBC6_DROKI